jgi:two-component sensor histidine kinase
VSLLQPGVLKGQWIEPDSLLSISELEKELHREGEIVDSSRVFKTAGIANVGSGQLHETYFQLYIQNDSTGISLFNYETDVPVSVGDSVVVKGKKQMYHGQPELRVTDYKVYPKETSAIKATDLAEVVADPDKYTGMLVKGAGVIIEKGYQFNGKYLMIAASDTSDKTIMVYVSNYHTHYPDFDFGAPGVGDNIRLDGVLGKYDPTYPEGMKYKVLLRTPEDFSHDGWPQYYLKYLAWILGVLILVSAGWTISLRRQVKLKTHALQESLAEKEVLLKEIHHRIKNNLARISGLLQLQSGTSESTDVKNALQESQTRINSMMMVHDKLYKSVSFKDISMKIYLEELAGNIHDTMASETSNIDVQVHSDDIEMNSDQVIPTGLLVNELLVNAFKHAFKGRKQGTIVIELRESNEIITLKVEDDGVGMPEDENKPRGSSLGMLLIKTFSKQLEAKKTIENTPGACFVFEFSLLAKEKD